MRYSAAFVNWRKSELQAIHRKTRKLLITYGALHSKSDVKLLLRCCVKLAIRGLEVYVHGIEERVIQAASSDKIDGVEAASVLTRSKKEKRLEDWEEKVLLGQYLRKEVRSDQVGLGFRMKICKGRQKVLEWQLRIRE